MRTMYERVGLKSLCIDWILVCLLQSPARMLGGQPGNRNDKEAN